MDELNTGLSAALRGPEADAAIEEMRRQLDLWEMAMPPVEPLVFDFGLGRFREVGEIEYWIANQIEAGYCGKFLFVFDRQSCPVHHHRKKHETFFIVKGRVRMLYDGAHREMGPGDVLSVERLAKHGFTGIGPALLLEVSTPCLLEDNYFESGRLL